MTPRVRECRPLCAGLLAEIAFAILPLLVVFLVLVNFEKGLHLFSSPEWSFGAAILFGQALVKFQSGLAHGQTPAARGPVALAVTLIIVVGLAPSLVFLVFVLLRQEGDPPGAPALWLQVCQVVFFVLSMIAYVAFGAIGELWRDQPASSVRIG